MTRTEMGCIRKHVVETHVFREVTCAASYWPTWYKFLLSYLSEFVYGAKDMHGKPDLRTV